MHKLADTIAVKRSNGLLAPAAGATLAVYVANSQTLATLYEDDEVTVKTNPLTANSNGLVECKIENGAYDLTYNNGIAEETIEGVVFNAITIGQEVIGEVDTVVTCSTALPIDDTIPQNTEGTQVVTCAITPASASSVLEITYNGTGSVTAGMFIGAAVFKDSDASAVAGSGSLEQATGANQKFQLSHTFRVAAGSTSAQTFKLRVGPHSSGTVYVNGDSSGSRLLGGNLKASLIIREILP